MSRITEAEFRRLCEGIYEDREVIIRHNPIGSRDEILLWMLVSCLVSYLSLDDNETPCFPGRPDAAAYRDAVLFILRDRKAEPFDVESCIDRLIKA
ncbi:MAG: hypothetical protein ACK4S4_01915 [Pyrinomonadaceae bacterium]